MGGGRNYIYRFNPTRRPDLQTIAFVLRDVLVGKVVALHSLKLTANVPENRRKGPKKERIVFQPSIFRGELLVSGRVHLIILIILIFLGEEDVPGHLFPIRVKEIIELSHKAIERASA